jgi:hypothetical protein
MVVVKINGSDNENLESNDEIYEEDETEQSFADINYEI